VTRGLLLLLAAGGLSLPPRGDPRVCAAAPEQAAALIAHVRDDLLQDTTWSRARTAWGWTASDSTITVVTDGDVCAAATAALSRDRLLATGQRIVLARAGNLYVAQPAERWDLWVLLDDEFSIIARITVPS
jgi:hypothetical protein